MPKLNKTRIINLNYNDGKRTIYDEIFDYGQGRNTLFSMENGIGKTVLIQFFLQPFMRNKRELAGRSFEDYFTGNAPTYILHEIALENGEKLLVGMIIKKDNSEEEKNKLKILTFLNRYSITSDFDLINAPFVEGKRILKFSEAEERIKKYKSGKLNFKYFNFNDSSKKSEYFEELRTYKLNYKEWEDIIRNINNDESGLSNLYDKHKTDEALVRNVIVPLIESKINGEKNIIEALKTNLSAYIENYKQNKESFDQVEVLKQFTYEMTPVLELLKQGGLKEEEKHSLYKTLSYINNACEKELSKKSRERFQLEELIEELKGELKRVSYEEYSLNYYKLQEEQEVLEVTLEQLRDKFNNKDGKRKELLKEKFVQEGAEVYEEILDKEAELAQVRERIANYEKDDSEIAQNIRNYKFSLKGIYELEVQELKESEIQFLEEKEKLNKSLKENEEQQGEMSLNQKENLIAITKAESVVENFETYEADFIKKYVDFDLVRNPLLKEYEDKELEDFNEAIENNICDNLKAEEELKKEKLALEVEKENLRKAIEEIREDLSLNKENLSSKKNELGTFNKESSKIIEVLRIKTLPLNIAAEKEKLKQLIINETLKLEESLTGEEKKLRNLEDTIHRYETGLIQLPKEVLETFENKGISFEYALNWLQNYKGNKEEKEALIKENPFFPYGILLSNKDITLLKGESLQVYTSIPIPIINKSYLNKRIKVEKNYDVITLENAEFLLAFNNLLIDEEKRIQLINRLKGEENQLQEGIQNIKKAIDRNKGYSLTLKDYPYLGNEKEVLEEEIKTLEERISKLQEESKTKGEALVNNENKTKAAEKQHSDLEKSLVYLKEKKDKFNQFKKEYSNFKDKKIKLQSLKKLQENFKKIEEELKVKNKDLHNSQLDMAIKLDNLKKTIKDAASKLELYRSAKEGVVIKEEKNILEGKLLSCEKQLGEDKKRDKKDEETLLKDLEKQNSRLKRIISDGGLSQEYKKISFSEEALEEVKSKIKALEGELKTLNEEITKVDKNIGIIESNKSFQVKNMEKLGYNNPLPKEEIRDSNFKGREKKIKEDLGQNDFIIKEYTKEIEKLRVLKQKLEEYKGNYNEEDYKEFNFKNLQATSKIVYEHIASYNTLNQELQGLEAQIVKDINRIYETYRDKNRLIKERIFSYLNKENKLESSNEIEYFLETVQRKISTLELELNHIKAEEEVVINDILRYAKHILDELKTIDKKSTIKHLGKTERLLQIILPEEVEEEGLREYIKDKVNFYGTMEDYKALLDSDIESSELLSKLIGNLNRIRVEIKKIEKTGLTRKSWKDVLSQNSGGEKFVSMFILLSSLMSYMRKREGDIDNKEEKKVIIMDNPFAKTNAEHLLEPMFQIAEKYNIQLLCFSGIGGSSVYNKFDKIYVAKVISDKFRNKENVSFKAGSEETLEMSDFTIGKEQISMF